MGTIIMNETTSLKKRSGTISALELRPSVILIIGMAGCGKTTLVHCIHLYAQKHRIGCFRINLDPAVHFLPYATNIDIRDTLNYKNVMKRYNLGPHGSILTTLNLFASMFDKVMALCEKECGSNTSFILADTPGQVEIFSWSA